MSVSQSILELFWTTTIFIVQNNSKMDCDKEDLPDFYSSPSLSDGDVASLLTSIADVRPDVPNAEEESDFLSFLTELERAGSD